MQVEEVIQKLVCVGRKLALPWAPGLPSLAGAEVLLPLDEVNEWM